MNLESFLEKNSDKKIVFTNGCFDLLHRGHLEYLKSAKELGDILIVGLNSDESVKGLKGDSRPINNESDRKFFLESLESVDWVEIFNEKTPLDLIRKVSPFVLVKGGDWKVSEIVGSEFVLENKGEVKSLQFIEGYSSTKLIEKIKKS